MTEAYDGEQNREKLAGHSEGHQDHRREGAHDVEDEALPDSVGKSKEQYVRPNLEYGTEEIELKQNT